MLKIYFIYYRNQSDDSIAWYYLLARLAISKKKPEKAETRLLWRLSLISSIINDIWCYERVLLCLKYVTY